MSNKPLTPEERASDFVRVLMDGMAAGGDYHGTPLQERYAAEFRAALRARDREWAEALRQAGVVFLDNPAFPRGQPISIGMGNLAALRALLKQAEES